MSSYFKSLSIAVFSGLLGFNVQASSTEYSYNGDTGPANWHQLQQDWYACEGKGKEARQSPIDISQPQIDRQLHGLDLSANSTHIHTINNGHTIEQHYKDTGSSITFKGVEYQLLQFHFHTYSEHTFAGAHADLEMHGVFNNAQTGNYLVISQMFDVADKENDFIAQLIEAGLPKKKGDKSESEHKINLLDGLTSLDSYYTYPGSLTTPTCAETVTWVVLKQRASISASQQHAFRNIMGNNFRPVQALNGRTISETEQ